MSAAPRLDVALRQALGSFTLDVAFASSGGVSHSPPKRRNRFVRVPSVSSPRSLTRSASSKLAPTRARAAS